MKNRLKFILFIVLLSVVITIIPLESGIAAEPKFDKKDEGLGLVRKQILDLLKNTSNRAKDRALIEMSKVVEQRIASRGGSCLQQWRINAGDSSAMLTVYTNPEYILDAIKAAESICAGDIKGALSVAEVRALKHIAGTNAVKAWIPGINVYILGLEVWVAYVDYLNNTIYNINKKKVYDVFRKDKDLWDPQTGINHFITEYVEKNYQIRIFVHEYATNDMKIKMPSTKTQWWLRTEEEGYPNRKTLRVIVAAVRQEMFRYYTTEMRVTRARKELLDELKSLKEMYSFIKDQQGFFAKRLKEVQEEMDKVTNKNKQLNQNYQNQVANIKSPYPQNPSSKYDYKNQPNEKEEAVRVARILSDNDQLYKSIRKKIDLFQKRPLDTIIAQKAYKSSNPNYANKWTLNRSFAVQPASTGGHGNGIKRQIGDLVAWYPKINVVDALIKRQDPSGNWYSEDTFKRQLDSLAQKAEDLDKFVKEIHNTLKSTLAAEQKHVEGINEQIKLIKVTGYERWDKEIREIRDKYYVAMLSHDYELDIDEERWENLSSEKKPILKDIETVIGSIEKTTSLGHTLREKFSGIKTANARAAEKLKLWKEKEFDSITAYFNYSKGYVSAVDEIFSAWESFYKTVKLPNPLTRRIYEETIAFGFKSTSSDGSKFIAHIRSLFEKYKDLPSREYLRKNVVTHKKVDQGSILVPKEFEELDRINYPVASVDDDWDKVRRAYFARDNFDEVIAIRKRVLKRIKENVVTFEFEVRKIYDEMTDFINEMGKTYYWEVIEKINITVGLTSSAIITETEAYNKAKENYETKLSSLISRVSNQKAKFDAEIERFKKEAEARMRDEQNMILMQNLYDNQVILNKETQRIQRYFNTAINNNHGGYAQILYLGAQRRYKSSGGYNTQAEEHYVLSEFSVLKENADKKLGGIIDAHSQITTRLNKMGSDLSSFVVNIDTLPEDTKHIVDGISIDDLISGNIDSDGDGYSDVQELDWGSDPLDNSDIPIITADDGDTDEDDDEDTDDDEPLPDGRFTNAFVRLVNERYSKEYDHFFAENIVEQESYLENPMEGESADFTWHLDCDNPMDPADPIYTLTIKCHTPGTGIYEVGSSDFDWAPESGYVTELIPQQGMYYAIKTRSNTYGKMYLETVNVLTLYSSYGFWRTEASISLRGWHQSNGSRYLKTW